MAKNLRVFPIFRLKVGVTQAMINIFPKFEKLIDVDFPSSIILCQSAIKTPFFLNFWL